MTVLSPLGTPGVARSFSPKDPATGRSGEQITQLSPKALPGKLYQFLPKTPSDGNPQITSLSPMGTPGGIYEFLPKQPSTEVDPDQITRLHPTGTPGAIYSFLPKDAAVIEPDLAGWASSRHIDSKGEDEELLLLSRVIIDIIEDNL